MNVYNIYRYQLVVKCGVLVHIDLNTMLGVTKLLMIMIKEP